jgi:basic amino acid/polyamine antiporter, APA family
MAPRHERALGPWRSWALVVGSIIGSAIFMMPAVLVPFGLLGLVSWASAGVGAIFVALMFANLSRRVGGVGGPFAYARAGFGEFTGFLIAWGYWIALWAACAAIAVSFTSYLGAIIPSVGASPLLSAASGLVMIWALIAINVLGVKEAGIVGLITTVMKLLPLAALGTVGLFFVQPNTLPPMNPGTGNALSLFASSFALTFWTFCGLEAATVPAEDVIDQRKTIPRALILGTLTSMVVYLLVAFAVMGIVPAAQLQASSSPLADAGAKLAGHWGATLVCVGAVVSTLGCVNCTLLLAGQTAMAAARAGVFPDRFQRLTRHGTPAFSLVTAGVLMSTLMLLNFSKGLVGAYTFIILIATLTTVVPYAFCAMSGLLLARHNGQDEHQRWSWESATAVVAFLVTMWVIASSGRDTVFWGFLLLMAGLPVYVMVSHNSAANVSRKNNRAA